MGYRESKSVIRENITVKDQRVDGSYIEYFNKKYYSMLRYTLVDFERSYQIKIPSNFINFKRNFCTLESKLNPFYVTGFVLFFFSFALNPQLIMSKRKKKSGEGCFILTIIKDNKYKSG
jgi:hypothetical protein